MVYLDANCIIYLVENHPVWYPKVVTRLAVVRAAGDDLVVGDLARSECLVLPFRNNDAGLEARYAAFFNDPTIRVFEITTAICERAARIRAVDRFKLPDALQLATAFENGCGLFLTADAQLARCSTINVEVLT